MIVKKIRLRNFRLVEDSTFSPEPTGITGLVGPNGSGKSSFLIGLRWALFGVRPDGEKNSGLIRQAALASLGDKERLECFVDVEVQIDNRALRVLRSMTRKGTVSAKVWVDGVERSVDSTNAANKAIISFLGLTPDMFSIAHVIGQDELNMLVEARPAKRRELIEGSVGIDVLSDAVSSASTDLSSTPTSVDMSEEVERLRSALRDAEATETGVRADYMATKDVDISGIEKEIRSIRGDQDRFNDVTSKRRALTDALSDFDESVLGMERTVPVPEVPAPDQGLQHQRAEAMSAMSTRSRLESQIEKIGDIHVIDTTATRNAIDTGVDWVSAKKSMLSGALAELEEMQRFDVNDIQEVCPLCGSELHDPERTRREREEKIRALQRTIEETKSAIGKGDKRLSFLRGELRASEENNALCEKLSELRSQLEAVPDTDVASVDALIAAEAKKIDEARRAAADASTKNDLFMSASGIRDRIQALPEVKDMGPELKEKELLLKEAQEARDAHVRAKYALDNAVNVVSNARRDVDNAVKRDEEARRINEERFIKSSTVSALRAYREEMLSLLGPELESAMSALVSEMTGEEYVSVRLDDGFNAYVMSADGEERPVSSLSGGERAIVSLALRMSLGGDNTGLLWMDEVGSALDADRLGQFMTGLHDLNRQVIVVDHRESASDEYDHVVRLARNSSSGWIVD